MGLYNSCVPLHSSRFNKVFCCEQRSAINFHTKHLKAFICMQLCPYVYAAFALIQLTAYVSSYILQMFGFIFCLVVVVCSLLLPYFRFAADFTFFNVVCCVDLCVCICVYGRKLAKRRHGFLLCGLLVLSCIYLFFYLFTFLKLNTATYL